MSGLIAAGGTLLSTLAGLVGSRARLQPATFRGVPFIVDDSAGSGGRRLVTHEFPLRDDPYTEDLGKLPRRFRLRAFVIDDLDGNSYLDARDDLIDACEGFNTSATLVHPTHGSVVCRAGILQWTERLTESFGWAEFALDFVQDGPQPSPISDDDTASSLLDGVASLLPQISAAYETAALALVSPLSLLDQVVGSMLGLPAGTILGLYNAIIVVSAAPTDLAATAAAVQTVTQAMAAAVIAGQAVSPDDPVTGVPFVIDPPADISGGLAGLASWGSDLAPIDGPGPQIAALAAQQAAVVAMVRGYATAALVQVYASIDWPDAGAAQAAMQQVLLLCDAQAEAAAAAGQAALLIGSPQSASLAAVAQDALYLAWQAMTALAMDDMIVRARGLGKLGGYSVPAPMPSVVIAHMLYQDATRAQQLEQLNDVPHPLFMPAAGLALSS